MRDGGSERLNLREGLIDHVHEFELDLEGSERQLKDFRPKDGISISIFKNDKSGCCVGEEKVRL